MGASDLRSSLLLDEASEEPLKVSPRRASFGKTADGPLLVSSRSDARPTNLFPSFSSLLIEYILDGVIPIAGTLFSMVLSQSDAIAFAGRELIRKNVAEKAAQKDLERTAGYAVLGISVWFPLYMGLIYCLVLYETMCAKVIFYSLLSNGYLLLFEDRNPDMLTLAFWRRPQFGCFAHIAVLWTIALIIFTTASSGVRSWGDLVSVGVNLVVVLLFYGKIIDLDLHVPSLTKWVSESLDGGEDVEAAIAKASGQMAKLRIIHERDVRSDVFADHSALRQRLGYGERDVLPLRVFFGDDDECPPVGLWRLQPTPKSAQRRRRRLRDIVSYIASSGASSRMWAFKVAGRAPCLGGCWAALARTPRLTRTDAQRDRRHHRVLAAFTWLRALSLIVNCAIAVGAVFDALLTLKEK
jgi:hypothetical protein